MKGIPFLVKTTMVLKLLPAGVPALIFLEALSLPPQNSVEATNQRENVARGRSVKFLICRCIGNAW